MREERLVHLARQARSDERSAKARMSGKNGKRAAIGSILEAVGRSGCANDQIKGLPICAARKPSRNGVG